MLQNFDKEIQSSFSSIPENARTRKSLTRYLIESRLSLSLSLPFQRFPNEKPASKGETIPKGDQVAQILSDQVS